MKKLTRKIISFILMILMVSNISISAFASETELSSKNTSTNKCNIVITDDGVYINYILMMFIIHKNSLSNFLILQ